MKLSRIFLAFALSCLASATGLRANETRPPYSTIEVQLNPSLPHVGDFTLSDKDANIYAIGRILVDWSSVYKVLINSPQAKGDCEFIHVQYKGANLTKAAVHQMRYFISFGASTIILNTESADTEVTLEFDFDPTKEIVEGIIRRPGLGDRPALGSCRIRIKDAPEQPKAK